MNAKRQTLNSKLKKGVAFFWDESFLWGIMAYKALKSLNLPFELIRAGDIRAGVLKNYKMLFVPGGWASNKSKVLGNAGKKAIQNFVARGGNYLGFCGGAGLATKAEDGIGLLNVKRKPTKERVPSFSGRIYLNINEHPIWNNLEKSEVRSQRSEEKNSELQTLNSKLNSSLITTRLSSPKSHHSSLPFHAWWPSQFLIEDDNIRVLATYGDALPDSFSSDLNVGDVENNSNWSKLERIYQINLNPQRLMHEPSVVEGNYGKGKVILSLIHFDTPDDINGQMVLKNLWEYLTEDSNELRVMSSEKKQKLRTPNLKLILELETAVAGLINLGEQNFLWFRRNPMLLQWRRGVRGLEYCTLYIMIKELAEILKRQNIDPGTKNIYNDMVKIKELLIPFTEKANQLLILERHAMQNGHITYENCNDPEIQQIRTDLFSDSKHHGGMFKELIDEINNLLFSLIK